MLSQKVQVYKNNIFNAFCERIYVFRCSKLYIYVITYFIIYEIEILIPMSLFITKLFNLIVKHFNAQCLGSSMLTIIHVGMQTRIAVARRCN